MIDYRLAISTQFENQCKKGLPAQTYLTYVYYWNENIYKN